jgi:hypothetical protein
MLPAPPLLSPVDFGDPSRFVAIRDVPIFDAHPDDGMGEVNEGLLHLIARNTQARVDGGDPVAITAGHTLRKTTVVVVRPDGSRVEMPGGDEDAQPDVLGYAANFRIAPFRGRPCLYCNFHVHEKHAGRAKGYPFRSVERLQPPEGSGDLSKHFIDRIALLKTPPQRDLGVLRYDQAEGKPGHPLRLCYSRPLPSRHHIAPPPRTRPMVDSEARIRAIARAAAADLFTAHYSYERQRGEMIALGEREDIDLPEYIIDQVAALDPDAFAGERDRIATHYARRSSATSTRTPHSRSFSVGASPETRRAVAYATAHGVGYDAALAAIRGQR